MSIGPRRPGSFEYSAPTPAEFTGDVKAVLAGAVVGETKGLRTNAAHGPTAHHPQETQQVALDLFLSTAAGGDHGDAILAVPRITVQRPATAVEQGLHLGADVKDVVRACQDDPVGVQERCLDLIEIVPRRAAACPVAGVACPAGLDFVIRKRQARDGRLGLFGGQENLAGQQAGISLILCGLPST